MLQKSFGGESKGPKETFRPLDLHACRWSDDPKYCGSYSVFPKGALAENYDDFFAPVKNSSGAPVIHFAGEAFDKKYSAFVHGAYYSGETIANEILS
jgi:monoamine oxidase